MRNILYNGNVIDPSEELTPVIRIAPFNNSYLYRSQSATEAVNSCKEYLNDRFGKYYILPKVRNCIEECIKYYQLSKDDVITILTSSGNFYISSCVTRPMEKYCKWSREILPETKVIFVNHEFGYPFKEWDEVEKLNIPIIEDCAYAYGTEEREIGKHGDFVLYSLPKFFPMQMGAILKCNIDFNFQENPEVSKYVINLLSQEYHQEFYIKDKRIKNYNYLTSELSKIGISPFFELQEGVIPGTYIFTMGDSIDYSDFRKYMESNGIECSVFYGCNAFFIPMNHNLQKHDLDYMIDLIKYYISVH